MNKRIKKKIEKREKFIKKLSKRERDELKLRSYIHTRLSETIDVPIVYYDKKKDGINIEYDTNIF